MLDVSRSAYYNWKKRKPRKWDIENQILINQIEDVFQDSRKTYGSPRIAIELGRRGVKASRPRIARLMKKQNLVSVRRKKFKTTTNSKHRYPVVENKLNRQFTVDAPGQVWVSDISYIKTRQGWLYLTVILDLADRHVVGWSMSDTLYARETTMAAWAMAIKRRPITRELIFHSDRGIQYACTDFSTMLDAYPKVTRSMSRKGDCWDNAVAESFFNTLKTEWVYQHRYITRQQARISIFDFIETWYNQRRIHTSVKESKSIYGTINNQKQIAA